MGEASGSLSSPEAGLVFIGEPSLKGASLKCMPQQSKLKSGTCITKRISHCQGFHYNSSRVCGDASVNTPTGLPVYTSITHTITVGGYAI